MTELERGALMSLALVSAAGAALCYTLPAPQDRWQAVVEWPSGDSDIVETGATLRDCMAILEPYSVPVAYCERESGE